MTIKDLINATQDKSANSVIIIESEGRLYQATLEVLEGGLAILHAVQARRTDPGHATIAKEARHPDVKESSDARSTKKV